MLPRPNTDSTSNCGKSAAISAGVGTFAGAFTALGGAARKLPVKKFPDATQRGQSPSGASAGKGAEQRGQTGEAEAAG